MLDWVSDDSTEFRLGRDDQDSFTVKGPIASMVSEDLEDSRIV